MAAIVWDKLGEKKFQTGIDRGVLYLADDAGAYAWNGLRSLGEKDTTESYPLYQDGVKIYDEQILGDYSATLTALTYPEAFDAVMGTTSPSYGVYAHDQPRSTFGLSYRTRLGDDLVGPDLGYDIHLLYQLTAVPAPPVFSTLGDVAGPVDFSWDLSAVPVVVTGRRPTAHYTIRSTDLHPLSLAALEKVLYGSSTTQPRLPMPIELPGLIGSLRPGDLIITNNGDGTFTATGSPPKLTTDPDGSYQMNSGNVTPKSDGTVELITP